MDLFKSPFPRLARLLHRYRNAWTTRALDKQQDLHAALIRK